MATPDLSDKYPNVPFILGFKSYASVTTFAGKIVTVECPDDNTLVREILSMDGEQSVLFINGYRSKKVALLGDNLAELAIKNNWAGIIVNGCIRDIQILRHMNLGIYALGSCPKKSNKNGKGQINATFSVDEVDIKPGYWIYADQNGILISTNQLES
jgi:regulator of ribonuclease activity A